jgi:hypothetical protein
MEMHGILNMKRIILAALLLAPVSLSNCAALAEDITVSVGGVSEVWTLASSDQQKFEAWVKAAYACTPVAPATTCETVLADAESAWAKATLQGTADNVTRFQNTVAATAAVQATTPIGFNVEGKAKKK